MEHMLGQVDPKRLIGDELLHETGGSVELTVRDYWRWSSSNLLDNAARGVFAEFIVASALGVAGGVRTEWDAYDLRADSGIKVEVKSAAYLQSWAQAEHSTIRFDIASHRSWSDSAGWSETSHRPSDVYVFCLLAHKSQPTVDPLDLSQWRFFVLPTRTLDEHLAYQKTLGLAGLLELAPEEASYSKLADVVENAGRVG